MRASRGVSMTRSKEMAQRHASVRVLMAAALVLALAADASARQWTVAAPGPCAEARAQDLCKAGACTGSAVPLRSRFDPVDVASGGATGQGAVPEIPKFPGPGACVEAGNSCGKTVPSPSRLGSPSVVEQPPVPAKPPGVP